MQFEKAVLQYNDQVVELPANKMTFFEELYVDFKEIDHGEFRTFHLVVHPKQPIKVQKLSLVFQVDYSSSKIFANGIQSQSESREFSLDEFLPKLKFWSKKLMFSGDEYIAGIPRGKSVFHSWGFTSVKKTNEFSLIGSLKENAALTYFIHNTSQQKLRVEKDCQGLELGHSFPILDVFQAKGNEKKVYNSYFTKMENPPSRVTKSLGWTSGYRNAKDNSEEFILKNIIALSEREFPFEIVEVGNGYCNAVGDWLSFNNRFPNGLSHIVQNIKQSNYKSSIWLAPLICSQQSHIFQQKKHWLLKDQKGNPVALGKLNFQDGKYFALDFQQKEVQDYLMKVILTFSQKIGFDVINLDHLFAACIHPLPNKTRGQLMNDVLEFLKTQASGKLILVGGVALTSAIGFADFCRVGSNENENWESTWNRFSGHRERPSQVVALRSIIDTFNINQHGIKTASSLFSLDKKSNKFAVNQQYTALVINALCSELILNGDTLSNYSDEQWSELEMLYYLKNSQVSEVQKVRKDNYIIHFSLNGKKWMACCNLTKKPTSLTLKNQSISLQAFETLILKSF